MNQGKTSPNIVIKSIFIDEFDNQWFGLENGLLWKSGDKWKAYYFSDNYSCTVNEITTNNYENNIMWLATTAGVFKISYTNIGLSSSIRLSSKETNLPFDEIRSISFDNEDIAYCVTSKGLGVLRNGLWKFYTKFVDIVENDFTSVQANSDTIYLGTKGEGVARIIKGIDGFSGASSYIWPWSSIAGDSITCICFDSKGNQWFGTTKGISKHTLNGARQGWDNSLSDKFKCMHIKVIKEDYYGNIWIGTNCGLNKFLPDTNEILSWTTQNGLISNTINCISFSKDNSIWIGTDQGISHFSLSDFKNFNPSEIVLEWILCN